MSGKAWPPRERMVYSAAQLVRSRGVATTGVRDVVAHADAPRGSFQHYFPGGKDQLVAEALVWSGDFAAQWAASYSSDDPAPSGLFAHMRVVARSLSGCDVMVDVAVPEPSVGVRVQ